MSPENPVSESRKHYIQVIVENRFGVLSRVAGLFSARGFNIDSLSVAPGLDTSVSQMTIETQGDDHVVEQIIKQLFDDANHRNHSDLTLPKGLS